MTRPNVILVICDQFRGDCLGSDGNTVVQTPNLDYLASRGTRFRHAYTAVPSCLPARATLWTGQSQWHTGVLGMGWGQADMVMFTLGTVVLSGSAWGLAVSIGGHLLEKLRGGPAL